MQGIQSNKGSAIAAKSDPDELPIWVVGYAAFGVMVILGLFAFSVLNA